jgi:D,D-heptose 1,7-bisphosphate phosphatase
MKAIIMAGGKGTRISALRPDIPKPMIEIFQKPILEYQIDCLKRQGYTDIVLIIGHLGHVIKDYFKDGADFGVHISYINETQPLGTAGALYYFKDVLTEPFLLINGDIIFDVDLKRFERFHRKKGGVASILTHPNDHPYDSGIILADENNCVTGWLHKEDPREWYKNRVNAGIHILSPEILEAFHEPVKTDLDRDILKPLISRNAMFCYDSPEYIKDIGTPERYHEVTEDIRSGKIFAKNLSKRQKAVFLDRDGTINKYVGFLTNIDDFVLNDYIVDVIRMANDGGYLVIVVSNQPVIARGDVTWDELRRINNKMETLLGKEGVYIDDIFICPHHPDKGFAGEIPEYKIDCECRKPKPGLLLEAAKKFNIDLSRSFMLGDDERDMEAGKAAGCTTIKVNANGEGFKEILSSKLFLNP